MMAHPRIAIIMDDTLRRVGLAEMLKGLVGFAEVCDFADCQSAIGSEGEPFAHYFIGIELMSEAVRCFGGDRPMIVIGRTDQQPALTGRMHFLAYDRDHHAILKSLMQLLQNGHSHFNHYPAEVASRLASEAGKGVRELTPREKQVLTLMAKGRSIKEMAADMHIAPATVMTHRSRIMDKFHAHSATQVIMMAVSQGMVKVEDI